MIMEFYALKDNVMGAFKSPFLQQNEAVARRSARWLANSGKPEQIEDNALYKLGYYNDETGEIAACVNGPQYICDVESLKTEEA